MFSLQRKDELVFGPSNQIPQQDKIIDDLIPDRAFIESNVINFGSPSNSCDLAGVQTGLHQTRNRDAYGHPRVLHRDIERKRRQDMSKLHASLRTLLPLELIKGKRSTCDHMEEAVNYIKRMRDSIQELQIRRDKLRRFCNDENGGLYDGNSVPSIVTVNVVGEGLEILVSCSFGRTEFGLSRMLAELVERDINVVSLISTKSEGRLLHRIQAEVSDVNSLNVSVLQQRLSHVVDLTWAS